VASIEELMAELAGTDPVVLERAIRGLAREGVQAIEALFERMEKEAESHTRINLLRALGRVAYENKHFDPRHCRRLRDYALRQNLLDAKSDEQRHEKATYVKVLGMTGEPGDFGELIANFNHFDSRVVANAVEGVAFIVKRWTVTGGASIQDALEKKLDDEQARVRVNAMVALYLIHNMAAETLREKLQDLTTINEPQVRTAARTALASFDISAGSFLQRFARDSIFALVHKASLDGWM